MKVLGDGDGVSSDSNRNSLLLSVNSSHQVNFLGLYVVTMLGNIEIALDEYDDHYGYTFCWVWSSLKTL